jgi:putative transposase
VQENSYFLSLLRYVEANPLRAKQQLVSRAQDWEWSSLGCDARAASELLSPWPLRRPPDWTKIVNRPLSDTERERIKASLERGRPLGDDRWTADTARRHGLQFTLNRRGRPRMQADPAGKPGK